MLTELLECSVCLEQLDHTSKVLPCQHTFCRRCLDEIHSTKHELRCPECRFLVCSLCFSSESVFFSKFDIFPLKNLLITCKHNMGISWS